jgi:MFS family permease
MKSKHPLNFLYLLSFIFSIQYSLVLYINSSFLESIASERTVTILYAVASFLSIITLLLLPRVLSRFGNYRASVFIIIANAFMLLLLGVTKTPVLILLFFLLYNVSNFCLMLVRDVFAESFTKSSKVGITRGLLLTSVNLAVILGPLVATSLVSDSSYTRVYLFAALFTLLSILCIYPYFKKFKDPEYKRISVRATLKKVSQDVNLKRIYFSQFLLCFFYCWMVIYMPVYLRNTIGFSWHDIGIIFAIMLIPFVLVDFPLGKMSDHAGEKKILAYGFGILASATFCIFFIHSANMWVWAAILFVTRIGAATVEVMNESYFFKKISSSDASLISLFRNIYPFSFMIAPLVALPVIFFSPSLEYLFLALAGILLLGFIATVRLKDLR